MHLWMYLVFFWKAVLCEPLKDHMLCTDLFTCYSAHYTSVAYDSAFCESKGVLTTMSTEQENQRILQLLENTNSGNVSFWIGLKREKQQCTQKELKLRGFRWKDGGSSQTEVSKWIKEPALTCTDSRCGTLKVSLNRNKVLQEWGWEDASCKKQYGFICKYQDEEMCKALQIKGMSAVNYTAHYQLTMLSFQYLPSKTLANVTCQSGKNVVLKCQNQAWQLTSNGYTDLEYMCLCKEGHAQSDEGKCVDIDECQKNPCEFKCVNTVGSFSCECDKSKGYALGEDKKSCLHQKGIQIGSGSTRMPFDDITSIVNDMAPNADEKHLSESSTRLSSTHQPLNERNPAPTSASGFTTPVHDEDFKSKETRSNVFIPVVVGIVVLVLLIVIVVGVFKCCFRKSSKTLKSRKRKPSNGSMDLSAKNNDSAQHVNENAIEKENNYIAG
ncbi:complement component C1q receptor-like [Polyodon spathula]|uniref:complement component C1q receptor-like n=1 Tax=Polyodon spathula TaxID=7913 RepID=UPI001B7E82E2|nr:complement component C1q receptor-like [Polyodon spathula]